LTTATGHILKDAYISLKFLSAVTVLQFQIVAAVP